VRYLEPHAAEHRRVGGVWRGIVAFGEVLAFDHGAASCVLKVAVRAPSSGSMSATRREGLPRNVEFVAYGPLLWRACCESRREGRRGRELVADFLENE